MPALHPDLNNIRLETWDHPVFRGHDLHVDILRLDKIHPVISGNKWFKLKYHLETARQTNKTKLVSFGGAYSNHLLALAAAAEMNGFSSVGKIRGESPAQLSHTLLAAKNYGMALEFLSRKDYDDQKLAALNETDESETDALIIPEGGAGRDGIRGAAEILSLLPTAYYSHICAAAGTGTTLAGIVNSTEAGQQILGISILKGGHDLEPMHTSWIDNKLRLSDLRMIHDFHFGGYAKSNHILLDFMNRLYADSGIPTDFVYTGKLFFAIKRLAELNEFPANSRILVLHTGGMQGNGSVPAGRLQF